MNQLAREEYVGEILVRHGVIDEQRLAPLFETVRERGQPLLELIVASNIADDTKIARALASEMGLDFVPKIDVDQISFEVASRLPITYAMQR